MPLPDVLERRAPVTVDIDDQVPRDERVATIVDTILAELDT